MNDAPDQSARTEPPKARFKPSRWPGWIWAVPIAALGIVGWLGLRELLLKGPEVTVRFGNASGIQEGNTKVKYQGMIVGQVDSITLEKDLQHVAVKLQLHSDMEGHLGPGTRYWISGQTISLSNLASIKSAVSGPDIEVDPQPGKTQDKVDGLAKPPVLKDKQPGREFVLETGRIGNVSRNTEVYFHDQKVGEVLSYDFEPSKRQFRITAFVHAPYAELIHPETRFWAAGPVHLATTPSGPSVEFQSVPAIMEGAIAFETPPDVKSSQPSPADAVFRLYPDKQTADTAPEAGGVAYTVSFSNQQSGLPVGAAVQLIDTPVGSVTQSTLEYDAANGALETHATIVIARRKLHIVNASTDRNGDPRAAVDAMMRRLIAQGLRAEMAKAAPMIGPDIVRLYFVPAAEEATLGPGDPPSIPATPGSGVEAIMTKASGIMDKVNAVPIDQIADNIQQATQKLAQLSQSPELTQSLQDLQQSMRNVRSITSDARRQVQPILDQVRQAAAQAQDAVRSAHSVLSSNGGGNSATQTAALPDTLYELGRAARSLRELADYLDRHPEALIEGRSRG